ncbi:MAG: c-type cytochrome biogenesis protein CcsB, partial [Lachnospiraceae bacterium]|nr:c-type cytochrome biogenesis protein CcsB [Lachnospiraceae bacterium]
GFLLHTLAILSRSIGAGRIPLSNQFEFANAFAWGITFAFLVANQRWNMRGLGSFVTPLVFLIIGYAAMQSREIKALVPALQSNWLTFHVFTAVWSYGAFGVACGIAMLYLCYDRLSQRRKGALPKVEQLDQMIYRTITFGFLFLTIVILTGAIWAKQAWGYYWSWDPKETWALITWFIYAIYLHIRISKGWNGKKVAVFAVIGFVCVIFTFIGVNLLIPGLHSYA